MHLKIILFMKRHISMNHIQHRGLWKRFCLSHFPMVGGSTHHSQFKGSKIYLGSRFQSKIGWPKAEAGGWRCVTGKGAVPLQQGRRESWRVPPRGSTHPPQRRGSVASTQQRKCSIPDPISSRTQENCAGTFWD